MLVNPSAEQMINSILISSTNLSMSAFVIGEFSSDLRFKSCSSFIFRIVEKKKIIVDIITSNHGKRLLIIPSRYHTKLDISDLLH